MNDTSLWNLSIIAARTAIVIFVLVLGVRIFGKREMAGMSVFDLVVVLGLANAVQNAMTLGSGFLLVGIVSGGTLIIVNRFLSSIFVTFPSFEAKVTGGPIVIVRDGQLERDNLLREGITPEEVMGTIRGFGLASLAEVKLVILEADGSLSVIPAERKDD